MGENREKQTSKQPAKYVEEKNKEGRKDKVVATLRLKAEVGKLGPERTKI